MAIFLFFLGWLLFAGTLAAFGVVVVLQVYRQGYPGLVSLVLLAAALLVVRGFVFFTKTRRPLGLPVDRRSQPGLLEAVRQVTERLGVGPYQQVVLIPEAETGILSGRWFFRPELVVGMALLESLSVEQFQAVLAGQLAPPRTRLLACIGRGISRVLRESERSLITLPFVAGARLIQKIAAPVKKAENREADDRAAAIFGKERYVGSLREAYGASQLFVTFLHKEILMLLSAGGLPDNLYSGYRIWLERTAAGQTPGEQRSGEGGDSAAPVPQGVMDKLPGLSPLGTQLEERLRELPPHGPTGELLDPRPAYSLLMEREQVERAVTPFVTESFHRQGLFRLERRPELVTWNDVEGRIIVPQQEARARHILRTLEGLVNRRIRTQEGIELYLSLLEVPDLRSRLAGRLEPSMSRLPPGIYGHVIQAVLSRFLGTLVGAALVEHRGYRWEKPIARPLELVGGSGERLNPFHLAQGLLNGEYGIRHFRMTLFEHGLFVSEK